MAEPVRTGLVTSLARPGGNLTGAIMLASDLESKRLGLLEELIPKAASIAVFVDPNLQDVEFQVKDFEEAGRRFGRAIRVVRVGREAEKTALSRTSLASDLPL